MQSLLRFLAGISVGGLVACGADGGGRATTGAGALQPESDGSMSSSATDSVQSAQMPAERGRAGSAQDSGSASQATASGAGNPNQSSAPDARNSGAAPESQPGNTPVASTRNSGALPDLVLDEAYLLDTTRFDIQRIDDPCAVQQGCATGLGDRRVVRFGSRMGNVGDADFVLGVPEEENPLWTLDACSDRFSLSGFARYELRDAATGRQVLVGTKSEFCMTDAEEWIPESGAKCQTYTCKDQGIRPGCADNYGTDLPCQWLDVTDVPPGQYELNVTVNAAKTIPEQDYTNDSVRLRLQIDANGGSVVR
jgi:hypothetical protein